MNARLKNLCMQRGYDLGKIESLIDLYDGDEVLAERLIVGRMKSHDDAHLMVTYKADDGAGDDGGDEYPPDLLDALENAYEALGDWDRITAALQQLASPPAKARVLTDGGKQSAFPTATAKAYNPARDAFALAAGADQAQRGRAATKATPVTLEALVKGYSWDGR